MKIVAMLLLSLFITSLIYSNSAVITSISEAMLDPLPIGISTFLLNQRITTTLVMGIANITSLQIGKSYIGFLEYEEGKASLQLNAVLNDEFWIQNVALFQQDSKSLKITFVINIWNLSGKFYIKNENITSYRGLGVLIYVGPTINISLPISLILFIKTNSTVTEFGYKINNEEEKVYYSFPIGGAIVIGGFSKGVRIPNSLEFVWGGPGDGSSVYINVNSTMLIYYLDNKTLRIPPIAYNFGFDTGEGVYNLNTVRAGEVFSPYAQTINSPPKSSLLWPSKPQIIMKKINGTLYVTLLLNNKPIPNQMIIVKNIFFQDIAFGITNQSGVAKFDNISSTTYIIYYPGNFTLSDAYAFNSEIFEQIYNYLKTEYDNLINFITNLNLIKHINSIFSRESSAAQNNYTQVASLGGEDINLTIISIIVSFLIGLVVAIILSRKT